MHSFTTERLLIRPLNAEDESFFCHLFTNEKVMRHTGGVLSQTDAIKAFQRSFQANAEIISGGRKTVMTWAIINIENMSIIGTQTISFLTRPYNENVISRKDDLIEAEIGIMLAPKSNGKLFPEEAISALIKYGVTQLKIQRINAFYSNKNFATKRFLNKLGFMYSDEYDNENKDMSYQYLYPKRQINTYD